MYEVFFAFTRRPFSSMPQIEEYFAAPSIETARQTLQRCIHRAEGAGLVIGPSGTGKTLLCRLLAEHFRDTLSVALLAGGSLTTRRALFQAILYEFGQPYRGMDESELRLALLDYLSDKKEGGAGMLLLVDEAHTLPLRLIDEVRMMTNLAHAGRPCVHLVLAGAPVLEERLASPKLESLAQRIVARCYLEAMTAAETAEYIRNQLKRAGDNGEGIFSAEACRAVHQATGGIPRVNNQLCDHALLLACAAGVRQVEPARVEEAWSDLQQLPTPWNAETRAQVSGGVVEFGGLDETGDSAALRPGAVPNEADETTRPGLCVTGALGEDAVEPTEQLDRIQGALAELDYDFRPAGSIGPEVELVFEEARSPLDEDFVDEQVVVDRYGSADCAGRSDIASPFRRDPALPAADAPTARIPAGIGVGDTAERSAEDSAPEARTVRMPSRPSAFQPINSAVDEEQIVVVDDGEEAEPGSAHAPKVVRRHEYSRLFARLRRTS